MDDQVNEDQELRQANESAGAQCEQHEWVVFSTALAEVWLMLQCVKCGMHGTVNDPNADEWSAAFHSPSKPYRWVNEGRVTLREQGPFCVVAKQPGSPCECIRRRQVIAPAEYERLPGGISIPDRPLSQAEQLEMKRLSRTAVRGGLCSRLLNAFLTGIQRDTGLEPSAAARRLARHVDDWDRHGLHMSPGVVAMILRKWADSTATKGDDNHGG